ncbi:MerR family transcriptional regulator [Paenibacillus arenilitoris]|uniref:MerR family transcriptional regulator n=1 Tax=Paenibacillus arenilitoris TaxID=2772299 RepID=A0A927H617_9BACL|nr:MerR family transcriptional regulator [Paenibacillus arenilitoris]MBD2868114.1 MerR family transcriptional regulator [Paenibacillus arenilitoris]
MTIRPIDIARRLKISTTALRHYEEWGIVPPVERAANGYRVYTDVHVGYFECIRAMNAGFGMQVTGKVMKKLIAGEVDDALWLMSESQASLYRDKQIADRTIRALETEEPLPPQPYRKKRGFTIGEVSEQTLIPTSAIRHWEKAGLLTIERDKENGYRTFTPANVRQILIIRTLKAAVWSLDIIKRIIKEIDDNNVENAIKTARESLHFLNQMNRNQLQGAASLHKLLAVIQEAGGQRR